MPYELYYWPTIQGRGEFIRLALEEAGADYLDVARLPEEAGMGMPALLRLLDGAAGRPPFPRSRGAPTSRATWRRSGACRSARRASSGAIRSWIADGWGHCGVMPFR